MACNNNSNKNNKVICETNEREQPANEIDLGLVKIEQETVSGLNSIDKREMHWEKNPQRQQNPKPFHRGLRMVNWREAEVYYLIDLIKSHAFIWDSSVPDFKLKYKKSQFWVLAADKVNAAFHPRIPFTQKDCFKKWNNLRTYFHAENKALKSKISGAISDTDDNVAGSWKFSSKMSFLIDPRLSKVPGSTFNNSDHSVFDTGASMSDSNGESEMESCEPSLLLETSTQEPQNNYDIACESYPGTTHAKHKNEPETTSDNILLYNMVNNVNKLAGVMSNEMDKGKESLSYYYSHYVGQCLDKLDADLNLEAREKINEILYKYEKAQLQRH